jgi:hypothetical protein
MFVGELIYNMFVDFGGNIGWQMLYRHALDS